MKLLFASYKTSSGFGNCTIELKDDESIETLEDIKNLQLRVSKLQGLKDVIIDNMIMLPLR